MRRPTLHPNLAEPQVPGEGFALRVSVWMARGLILFCALIVVLSIIIRVDKVATATGVAEPLIIYTVRAPVSGDIAQLHVVGGALVSEGTPLLTIYFPQIDSLLSELQSDLAAATRHEQQQAAIHALEVERAYEEESLARHAIERARAAFQLALVLAFPGQRIDVDSALSAPQRDGEINIGLARSEVLASVARERIARLITAAVVADTTESPEVLRLKQRISSVRGRGSSLTLRVGGQV